MVFATHWMLMMMETMAMKMSNDSFPLDPSEWEDTDNDNIGNNADSDDDGDGFSDNDEIACGSDPLDGWNQPSDFDSDGICDLQDSDDDNDGYDDENRCLPNG